MMTKRVSAPFPRCYAQHLGGCTHKSREHFISRSILEIVGGPFSIQGFPWLKSGEVGKASAASLTSNVLCDRHNSSLSILDSEAARFFGHLKLLDSKTSPSELAEVPAVFSVDGVLLEKWLLKALCGIMASGNFLIDGKSFGKVPPSEYLVNLLFSDRPWKKGVGLYADYTGRQRVDAYRGIGFDPVTARSGTNANIVGIDVHFWGFPLRGLFATYQGGPPLEGHRPTSIRIANRDVSRDIVFVWPRGSPSTPGPVFTRDGTKC
jgi:hypothetical protein